MGVKLGAERLKVAAQLLGIGTYDSPAEACGGVEPELWNASTDAVKRALAQEKQHRYRKVTRYDLALIGYGQGYAGQMTPFRWRCRSRHREYGWEAHETQDRVDRRRNVQASDEPQQAATMRGIMGLELETKRDGARSLCSSESSGHQHRRQNRNRAESPAAVRSEDGRTKDAAPRRKGQQGQHHPGI